MIRSFAKRLRKGAFTLIELLVVIAIIGILVGLLLPAVQAAQGSRRRTQCMNNLRQIGLALLAYHEAHGSLPYAAGDCCGDVPTERGDLWTTAILPELDQNGLYDQIDHTKSVQNWPQSIVSTIISTYICPSDPDSHHPVYDNRFARDNPRTALGLWYTGSMGPTQPDLCPFCPDPYPSPTNWCCQGCNWGTLATNQSNLNCFPGTPQGSTVGMFGRYRNAITFGSVSDGCSNTIMNGETLPGQCIFISTFAGNFNISSTAIPINTLESDGGQPTNWWRTSGFKSLHPGGANFAMADGSVHFFSQSIDFQLYNALGTRAGHEAAAPP